MKFVLMALVSMVAVSVSAKSITCVDRNLQDATLSATFDLKKSQVKLFVPTGETSGEDFTGECRRDEGAIEMALTCNVMTSTDSGYEVRLYSIGGSELYSTMTSWSMAGSGKPVTVTCDN